MENNTNELQNNRNNMLRNHSKLKVHLNQHSFSFLIFVKKLNVSNQNKDMSTKKKKQS
jgi:hypothetical protein